MLQKFQPEHVETVRATTRIQHVTRYHRVEVEAGELDSGLTQDEEIELSILRCLRDARVFDQLAHRLHVGVRQRGKIHDVGNAIG